MMERGNHRLPSIGRKKECPEELKALIVDLEKKLRSKA